MSRWTWVGTALAVLVVAAVTLPYGLSGDIRYEMGVTAVSGHGAADTFTHRPLLYRLLSAALTAPAAAAGDSIWAVERVLRAECVALSLLAAAVLWAGLRRRLGADAGPVALVSAAALVLVGPQITLEPDWLAVVLTVLGLGAALALPHRLPAAVVGGVLLAAAAATKIVTLPVALIGLLGLLLLDRRRVVPTAVAATVAGLLYAGAVLVWAPHEIGWLLDMRSVQPPGPPVEATLAASLELLGNAATLWPAVALLPAALVGAPGRLKGAALAGAALAWLPAQVQGQYFIYHLAALPVVAAVVLVLALRRAPVLFVGLTLAASGWTAWVLTTSVRWRSEHLGLVFLGTAVVAVGCWAYRLLAGSGRAEAGVRPPASAASAAATAPRAAVVAVLLASLAASTPWSAASVSLVGTEGNTPLERRDTTRRTLEATDRVRAHIGADSPVTYLTFGSYPYFLGNPTNCRYPSPVFLQRGWPQGDHPPTRAWTEALACITDTPGDWLVWDTNWFRMHRQPAVVKAAIATRFDCDRAYVVGRTRVCPRR